MPTRLCTRALYDFFDVMQRQGYYRGNYLLMDMCETYAYGPQALSI